MNQPIHILQIIDGLELGGAEGLLYDLTTRLAPNGFRVSVCYFEPGQLVDEFVKLGFPVKRIPWSSRVDLAAILRIKKLIQQDPPQIVHTHLFKSDFNGRLAARLAGVPVVLSTLHNCDSWARNPIFGPMYGVNALLADRLIAVADEVREFALQNFHIPGSRIVTIRNAIQIDHFENNASLGSSVRSELGIPSDAILFGIIARLDPQKDHENFLRSAAIVKNTCPNARFMIVGDGRLGESLKKLSTEMGLDKYVIFCGMRKDIPAVLSAMDVLVLSSQYEGLPMVLLEAMAASKPVVATAVNGVPGVVVDRETGFLVPPQNSQALADVCLKLAANKSLRLNMGESGYQRVKKYYNINDMTKNTIALYHALLERHGLN